jgi:hypothetical protein
LQLCSRTIDCGSDAKAKNEDGRYHLTRTR